MKNIYHSLIILFLLAGSVTNSWAQTGRGTLKGKVVTADNKPADNVSVALKATKYGTITTDNGEYVFKAPAGTYTLTVSYVGVQPVETSVTVVAGQTVNVPVITIAGNAAQLNEVNVVDNRVNKYVRKKSYDAAKMPLNNLENAQVYNTITNDVLKEQQLYTVDDALRNAPGLQKMWEATGRGGDGGSYYNMRGFIVQSQLRNGIAGNVTSTLDAVNLEKIEVIKGPSGTLYGSTLTSFGGLINRVTKKPFDSFGAEITHSLGSYDLSRTSIDLNTPLNAKKNVLFRLNTAYTYEGSFRNNGFNRQLAVAPSLQYNATNKLSFLFDAEMYFGRNSALPILFPLSSPADLGAHTVNDLKFDYKQSYWDDDVNQRSRNMNYFAQANYKISDKFTSQTVFTSTNSFSNGFNPYLYLISDAVVTGNAADAGKSHYISRNDQSTRNSKLNNIEIQENLNGDFNIGNMRNRLLVGLDYFRRNSNQFFFGSHFDYAPINNPGFDYTNLNRIAYNALYASGTFDFTYPIIYKSNTYSAYVSDVLNITDQLIASAALRLDYLSYGNTYNEKGVKTADGYNQTTLSPKFGLVYQPIKDQLSFFANYQNGFLNPGPYSAYSTASQTATTLIADVQSANQIEGGVKIGLFNNRLTGSVSYYSIKLSNVLRTDPNAPVFSQIQDGTQTSKGIETEIIANPLAGLNVIAGFSYNNSKYTKSDADVLGRRPNTASSPYLGNLWISYKFHNNTLDGFGLGFGGNYASENKIVNSNSLGVFTLPSYTVLNSSVFYEKPKYRFGLSANNLTNERYYIGYGTINPQKLRQVILSASYKF